MRYSSFSDQFIPHECIRNSQVRSLTCSLRPSTPFAQFYYLLHFIVWLQLLLNSNIILFSRSIMLFSMEISKSCLSSMSILGALWREKNPHAFSFAFGQNSSGTFSYYMFSLKFAFFSTSPICSNMQSHIEYSKFEEVTFFVKESYLSTHISQIQIC